MGTLIIITIAQFSSTQLRCDLPDLCCPHLVFVFPPNCDITTTLFSPAARPACELKTKNAGLNAFRTFKLK